MKHNYDEDLINIINNLKEKPTLLLHSCCAPCSSYVLTLLKDHFNITVLYYNPNIAPLEEYLKRKEEQIKLINELNKKSTIKILDCDYDNDLYEKTIKGLELEKERGSRCTKCFNLRLEKTAELGEKNNFEYFATTLTVSPYKNAELINQIGLELEKKYKIKYLVSDFKKRNGYKTSIELSKKYDLYRQNYCGCIYSKRVEYEE